MAAAVRRAVALDFVCEEPTNTFVLSVGEPDVAEEGKRMQVQVSASPIVSWWHRRIPGTPETACGLVLDSRDPIRIRYEQITELLCPDCFTKRELELAAKHNAEEDAKPGRPSTYGKWKGLP